MRISDTRWMAFEALVVALALQGCLAGPPPEKGEDPEPALEPGKADALSERASPRGALEPGVPVRASFDGWSHHLYALEVGAGAVVDLSLAGEDDPDLDTVLRIYGPADDWGPGARLAMDDDGGPGLSSFLAALELPAAGAYAVVASTYGGRPAPGAAYRLAAECRSQACAGSTPAPRTLHLEVDALGDVPTGDLLPEAWQRVREVYLRAGLDLDVHPGTSIAADEVGQDFDYDEFRGVYFDHFEHRGEPGWSYLVVSGVELQGGIGGWGRLGGDMAVLSPNWTRLEGAERLEEQIYICLHELGHNLGLVHAGLDADHPHDATTCVMAPGSAAGARATGYCNSCLAHLDPDQRPAW